MPDQNLSDLRLAVFGVQGEYAAMIDWLANGAGGAGVTAHSALTGLADDDHPQYLLTAGNLGNVASPTVARANLLAEPVATLSTIGATGADEVLAPTVAVHNVTMDQACTFSFTAPAAGRPWSFLVHLFGAFTPTWPGTVEWVGGVVPTHQSGTVYSFLTYDGGVSYFGFASGPEETLNLVSAPGATETLTADAVQRVELDANLVLTFPTAASGIPYSFTLVVVQDVTPRTITWPAAVDWPAATAPTLSAASGAVDVFTFLTTDGGATWLGMTAGQAFA